MKAEDVMTTKVITVTEHQTKQQAALLLSQHRISGLPVVNNDNIVVGVVTHASKKPFRGTNVWNPPVVPAGNVVGVGQSLSCSDLERWNPNAA